jgi:hypothetical protein
MQSMLLICARSRRAARQGGPQSPGGLDRDAALSLPAIEGLLRRAPYRTITAALDASCSGDENSDR